LSPWPRPGERFRGRFRAFGPLFCRTARATYKTAFSNSLPLSSIRGVELATLWALDTPPDVMAKALYMLVIFTGILTVGA
jgi:hypothetical protein